MSALLPQIDHIAQGIGRVISQYRDKPRLLTLWATYLWQVQHLEDAIHETVEAWRLENATGWRLDVLGGLVGQPRIGSTDEIYKAFIQARIRVNRSRGKVSDLLAVADLLIPGYTYLDTGGPRGGNAYFKTHTTRTAAEVSAIRGLMKLAAGPGIRVWLVWSEDVDTDFVFTDVNGQSVDANNGFCDLASHVGVGTIERPGRLARIAS